MRSIAIDIVMPTYNNCAELRGSLEALRGNERDDFAVLVCVDGSTDGTLEFLAGSTFPFTVRALEHDDRANHGRAAARNLALPHLSSGYVLLLDSDMRLAPDGIARHLELLARRDCVSVGEVRYANAKENLWARYLATRGHHKAPDRAEIRPVDFHTANSALLAVDLRALGGFDETLEGYGGEDTELGLRLKTELGRTFVFNSGALAVTHEPKTVEAGLEQLRHFGRTNLRKIRRKHPDAPAPFWIDRLKSRRLRDRAFRVFLNPLTDTVVDLLLPRVPFAVQRRLLNYKVIRAVFQGYEEATR